MRRLVAALLVVLLLAGPARASMVVILASPDRIVAACDSRRVALDDDGNETDFADDTRKLQINGQALMFANGHLVLDTAPQNRGRLLDPFGAFARLQPGRQETARQLMGRLIIALQRQRPDLPPRKAPALIGIFRFRPGSVPDARIVRLDPVPGGAAQITSDVEPWFVPYSYVSSIDQAFADSIGQELTAALKRGRKSEGEMIELARAAIQRGAERIHSVGGPVHVVVVDAAGPRWIRGPLREE